MKKQNHKVHSLRGLFISKCFIGSIINGAVNAGVFYLLNLKHEGMFHTSALYLDFALTVAILGVVISLLSFSSINRAVKKGKAPSLTCYGFHYSLANVMPKNKWTLMGILTILMTLLVPAFFIGVSVGLGFVSTNIIGAMILKGIVCAVASCVINYTCIVSRLHVSTTCVIRQNSKAAA